MATVEEDISDIPIIEWADLNVEEIPIGRGGYGTVYRGTHSQLGMVAIKTLISNGPLPQKHVKVLQQEAQKLRELCQHEGILGLHGLVMERDNYSLVLEYMPLGSVIDFRKEFSVQFPLYVRIAKEVISALDYLHSRQPQVLHLDLKADNILLDKHISAKVSDFGLAEWKTVTMTATRRTDQAQNDRRCTVSHVPPEVWSNINKPSDQFYDIYSFGICLWEMLAGTVPYGSARDDLIRSAVLTGQRPDVTHIPAGCPPMLIQFMTRCWSQKPSKRPAFSVLKAEIYKKYEEEFRQQILGSLKSIRQEIINRYPAHDPVYTSTSDIDTMTEPTSEEQVMEVPDIPATSQEESISVSHGDQDQGMEIQDINKYLTETVSKKDETKMDTSEQNLRKILRDPAALRIARTKYITELFPLNKEAQDILNENDKLKQYIESDILFSKEIFYPGNNFWENVNGSYFRIQKHNAKQYMKKHPGDMESIQYRGRHGGLDWDRRINVTERTKRRKRVERSSEDHPYVRDIKKEGSYHQVKKALQNPEQLKQLLLEQEGGQNSLNLTTLNSEVLSYAQDPVVLMGVLQGEKYMKQELISKHLPLLTKLVSKARQEHYSTRMGRDIEMMMMDREMMMGTMDPEDFMMMREMMRRRHRMRDMGHDKEDHMMSMMSYRRQMMKEMRPRHKMSSNSASKMMKASDEARASSSSSTSSPSVDSSVKSGSSSDSAGSAKTPQRDSVSNSIPTFASGRPSKSSETRKHKSCAHQ